MKTRSKSVSRRLLILLGALALLSVFAIAVENGSVVTAVSGLSDLTTTHYNVVFPPQPDAAEIDRQVQQTDAKRFGLGYYSAPAPVAECERIIPCPY